MALTYTQLQARATYLASFEGWSDSPSSVGMDVLINRAWYKFSTDARLVIASQNVTTVIGTAAYTLTGVVVQILDVIYDTASAKTPVRHATEDGERWANPAWRVRTSGTPLRYTYSNFNGLTFVPAPDAVKTVSVRAFVQGTALSAGSDVLPIPEFLEEAVPLYAAYLQGVAFSQAEGSARLQEYLGKYLGYVQDGLNYGRLSAQGN